MRLKLEYNNLLDVINLNFKVYNPLDISTATF